MESTAYGKSVKKADMLLDSLLSLPQTRMKEIAPAESLFQTTLSNHPELFFIIRTNSKGLIVNSVSRGDSTTGLLADMSTNKWFRVPQATMKSYKSPAVPVKSNTRRSFLFSKPIRISNASGTSRFGGVVAFNVNVDTSLLSQDLTADKRELESPPQTCKAAAAAETNRDSDLIRTPGAAAEGQPAIVQGNRATQPDKGSNRRSHAEPQRNYEISSTHTGGFLSKVNIRTLGIAGAAVVFVGWAFFMITARRMKKLSSHAELQKGILTNEDMRALMQASAVPDRSVGHTTGREPQQGSHGEVTFPSNPAQVLFAEDATQEILSMLTAKDGSPAAHETSESIRSNHAFSSEVAIPVPKTAPVPTVATTVEAENEESLKEQIRSNLLSDLKKEIQEKEGNSLRNTVVTELKADIRRKLEENEAESIRALIQQELTDSWRRELQEQHHDKFYKQEMEALRKIIREKLVEKEMPLLVKAHRIELSQEIREKLVSLFSERIEQEERNAMKAEIVKKLQMHEYPQILQEEREKLRTTLGRQVEEKETEAIEARLREELMDRLRARLQTETPSLEKDIRQEMAGKIKNDIMLHDYEEMVERCRDELKERIRKEIVEKEMTSIRDTLLRQVTEEEGERIKSEELGQIIESQRSRIIESETPALREQVRQQLHDEELETMHTRVKSEIYSETVQALQASCEEKYNVLLEQRMAQYQELLDKRLRSEIRNNIKTEYRNLIEQLEDLSNSIGYVEAVDSLSKTIALIGEEKKKYKYFNLNSAQTDSLFDYLKRVQNRFSIFLDKTDGALQEIELKINNIMNKLDGGA